MHLVLHKLGTGVFNHKILSTAAGGGGEFLSNEMKLVPFVLWTE